MPRLLVVHHTTSPALQAMLKAAVAGARDPELDGVEVASAMSSAPPSPPTSCDRYQPRAEPADQATDDGGGTG